MQPNCCSVTMHYGVYKYTSFTGENFVDFILFTTLYWILLYMFCAHAEASRCAACDVACLVYELNVHIILKEVMHWQ